MPHDQPLADAVTPSAFCQARRKLNPPALMVLNGALLEGFQRHFCARMSLDFSGEVTAFLASGKTSDLVLFSPGTEARKRRRLYRLSCEPIPLRLIRVQLKAGEAEVLATSLLANDTYPRRGSSVPLICAGVWSMERSAIHLLSRCKPRQGALVRWYWQDHTKHSA